jgi:hypothetical protein
MLKLKNLFLIEEAQNTTVFHLMLPELYIKKLRGKNKKKLGKRDVLKK